MERAQAQAKRLLRAAIELPMTGAPLATPLLLVGSGCCSPTEQEVCCTADAKEDCCRAATSEACGCR